MESGRPNGRGRARSQTQSGSAFFFFFYLDLAGAWCLCLDERAMFKQPLVIPSVSQMSCIGIPVLYPCCIPPVLNPPPPSFQSSPETDTRSYVTTVSPHFQMLSSHLMISLFFPVSQCLEHTVQPHVILSPSCVDPAPLSSAIFT